MRVALDTNVVAYAEGLDDANRGAIAAAFVEGLAHRDLVLPVQVCAELVQLAIRKFKRSVDDAATIARRWGRVCVLQPETTNDVFRLALELSVAHRVQFFDAIILAAAAQARCQLLLSEDMSDGFVWRGVTVVNPFAASPHPMLTDALAH